MPIYNSKYKFPEFAEDRGLGYWLRPKNLLASRNKFLRTSDSISWRQSHTRQLVNSDEPHFNRDSSNSVPFSALVQSVDNANDFKFVILGDTGEGDQSQYCTIPLIRLLDPSFMIINGDIAYPAGRTGEDRHNDDYLAGFFEPYKNLNMPIWAVPGNHEYYSPHKGKEFFEVFCSQVFRERWDGFGLRFVSQPGAFWELRNPDSENDLVVIGLDSGQTGNLDGHKSILEFWKKRPPSDSEQLAWLNERLLNAEAQKDQVIILYHIPSLTDQKHKTNVHLSSLHKVIADFSCVRLIITGHEHNLQYYEPEIFRHYIEKEHVNKKTIAVRPHYFVSGGGGAYLTSTDFARSEFPCAYTFPTSEDWKEHAGGWRRSVEKTKLAKTVAGRLAKIVHDSPFYDADEPSFLSCLLVHVRRVNERTQTSVIPIFLRNLDQILDTQDGNEVIDILAEKPPFSPNSFDKCAQKPIEL